MQVFGYSLQPGPQYFIETTPDTLDTIIDTLGIRDYMTPSIIANLHRCRTGYIRFRLYDGAIEFLGWNDEPNFYISQGFTRVPFQPSKLIRNHTELFIQFLKFHRLYSKAERHSRHLTGRPLSYILNKSSPVTPIIFGVMVRPSKGSDSRKLYSDYQALVAHFGNSLPDLLEDESPVSAAEDLSTTSIATPEAIYATTTTLYADQTLGRWS